MALAKFFFQASYSSKQKYADIKCKKMSQINNITLHYRLLFKVQKKQQCKKILKKNVQN